MFTSRDAAKVSATLAVHAHPPLRAGEIARATGMERFRVQNGIRALLGLNLVKSHELRGSVSYEHNSSSPHLRAVKAAALADVGIREALASIASRIRFAMVIGSFARGQVNATSDLDLLIVGDTSRAEVEALVGPLLARHDRQIDAIVLTDNEYHDRLKTGDPLLQASINSGQLLLGDQDLV